MKKISILLLLFFSLSLAAADKKAVLEAYNKLRKSFSYVDKSGKTVRVSNLKYNCRGNNCNLIVNGKTLDPAIVLGGTTPVKEAENVPVTPPPLPGKEPGNMAGMTEAHNVYRRALKIPDLVWDDQIAAYAQEWANNLKSKNCSMTHRTSNKYGENLAWSSGWKMGSSDVVKMWYDEVKDYNYSTNSCKSGAVCGHYTQVVWKNSLRLGCAMASCNNSEIWVCNYDPPGNYVGQKPY